jgi:integrase
MIEPHNPQDDIQKQFDSLAQQAGFDPKKPVPNGLTWKQTVDSYLKYIPETDPRFTFGYLYLTGQRATEAINTKRSDITLEELEGKEFIKINSKTLKNTKRPYREIAIPLFGQEKIIAENTWKYIESIKNPERLILPVTRRTLVNWLKSVQAENIQAFDFAKREYVTITFNMHPHYLRHTRAFHMAQLHNFDLIKMMTYFGWTDSKMPLYYIRNDWLFLAKQIAKGGKL